MSFHRRRSALAMYEAHAGPNMTPMVDVVMVILIFFMASAAILGPEWFLKTSLPRTTTTAPPNESLLVRVRVELVMDNGVPRAKVDAGPAADIATIEDALKRALDRSRIALNQAGKDASDPAVVANVAVLVDAGDDVPYEQVVRVHELARALHIEKIGIVE